MDGAAADAVAYLRLSRNITFNIKDVCCHIPDHWRSHDGDVSDNDLV
jgi:hypothetical protein